jgi:hypothetical protein
MLEISALRQPPRQQLLPGMPNPAIASSTTFTDLRSSVYTQFSTVTISPSELPASSPTGFQGAPAQTLNGTHLSAGAIAGIVVGLTVTCVLLFAVIFLDYKRRRFKAASQRYATTDDTGYEPHPRPYPLPELDDRDNKKPEMSQAAPEIRLIPADETTIALSSRQFVSRPDNLSELQTTADTDGNSYDLRVNTDSVSSAFGSVNSKGKGRLSNSETPISAATTLVSSSSSPKLLSRWERSSLANTNTSPAGTLLRPDSALT